MRTMLDRLAHRRVGEHAIELTAAPLSGRALLGGPQTMLAVNESGLYALIFTSRKPEAKRFRKWVTNEVLPAIGRPGDTWAIPRTTPIRSSSGRSSSASDLPTSS